MIKLDPLHPAPLVVPGSEYRASVSHCQFWRDGECRSQRQLLRRAYRGTTEIQLSPRDLKVLRLLFERRGKIVDRNMLADEVWGIDYFPESRALDQHISQLRKRIENDAASPRIIRTVHGAGYRFE